jgi:hypothetical protein
MSSKNLMKHFKDFGNEFTKLCAKFDADTLLDFATHHGQNETRNQKSTRVRTVMFIERCHVAD